MASVMDLFKLSLLEPSSSKPSSPWMSMRAKDSAPSGSHEIYNYGPNTPVPATFGNTVLGGVPQADEHPLPSNQIPWSPQTEVLPNDFPIPSSPPLYNPMPPDGMTPVSLGGSGGRKAPKGLPQGGGLAKEDLLQKLFDRETASAMALRGNAKPFMDQFGVLSNSEQGMDLSALATLVDQWTGSNMARGYKAPENLYDKAREVTGQADKYKQAADQQDVSALKDLVHGRMEQSKMASDKSYKDAMLEMERTKLGIEALKAGAKGGIDPKEAFQIQKELNASKPAEQARGIMEFNTALNSYVELVNKHGVQAYGPKAAELDSAYSKLKTSYKNAEALGALSGPDVEILVEAIRPAAGFMAKASDLAGSGIVGSVNSQADQLRKASDSNFVRIQNNLKAVASPVSQFAAPMLQDMEQGYRQIRNAGPSATAKSDNSISHSEVNQALTWAQANPTDPRARQILSLFSSGGAK